LAERRAGTRPTAWGIKTAGGRLEEWLRASGDQRTIARTLLPWTIISEDLGAALGSERRASALPKFQRRNRSIAAF
jgi:hypothetical protein